jgi:hypothetical protein
MKRVFLGILLCLASGAGVLESSYAKGEETTDPSSTAAQSDLVSASNLDFEAFENFLYKKSFCSRGQVSYYTLNALAAGRELTIDGQMILHIGLDALIKNCDDDKVKKAIKAIQNGIESPLLESVQDSLKILHKWLEKNDAVTCDQLKEWAEAKKIQCGESKAFGDLSTSENSYAFRVEQVRSALLRLAYSTGKNYSRMTPEELDREGDHPMISLCTFGTESYDRINIALGDNPFDTFFFQNSLHLLNMTIDDGTVLVDKKACDVDLSSSVLFLRTVQDP